MNLNSLIELFENPVNKKQCQKAWLLKQFHQNNTIGHILAEKKMYKHLKHYFDCLILFDKQTQLQVLTAETYDGWEIGHNFAYYLPNKHCDEYQEALFAYVKLLKFDKDNMSTALNETFLNHWSVGYIYLKKSRWFKNFVSIMDKEYITLLLDHSKEIVHKDIIFNKINDYFPESMKEVLACLEEKVWVQTIGNINPYDKNEWLNRLIEIPVAFQGVLEYENTDSFLRNIAHYLIEQNKINGITHYFNFLERRSPEFLSLFLSYDVNRKAPIQISIGDKIFKNGSPDIIESFFQFFEKKNTKLIAEEFFNKRRNQDFAKWLIKRFSEDQNSSEQKIIGSLFLKYIQYCPHFIAEEIDFSKHIVLPDKIKILKKNIPFFHEREKDEQIKILKIETSRFKKTIVVLNFLIKKHPESIVSILKNSSKKMRNKLEDYLVRSLKLNKTQLSGLLVYQLLRNNDLISKKTILKLKKYKKEVNIHLKTLSKKELDEVQESIADPSTSLGIFFKSQVSPSHHKFSLFKNCFKSNNNKDYKPLSLKHSN